MDCPSFTSENNHWCDVAQHYYQKSIEIQKELDEYTEASGGLEKELEASLEQKDKLIRDLRQQNQRLERENDFIKKKIERTQQENSQFECEIKSLKCEKEKDSMYIRELEQKNDDLERGQRVIKESVAGAEQLLSQAYERNAVLESEVDEMENLRVKLQRLSDEARDLKQELHVKDKMPNGNVTTSSMNDYDLGTRRTLDTCRFIESETQTNTTSTPLKRELTHNGNTMTPSARISALNIVGDLLRKVGLEKFLCSECNKVRCICEKSVETMAIQTTQLDNVQISSDTIHYSPHSHDPLKDSQKSWLLGLIPETKSTFSTCNQHANIQTQQRRVSPPHLASEENKQNTACSILFSRGSSYRRSGLESKLASCRAPVHSRDSPHNVNESYRSRRINSRTPSSAGIAPNYLN